MAYKFSPASVLPQRFSQPKDWVWSHMPNKDQAILRCGSMVRHEKPLANIVVQPGLSEPVEKFFETFHELSQLGCNVYAMSWRGQGGSTPYLPDHFRRHSIGFDRDARDLEQFINTRVPANAPRYILAHSMGALISTLAIVKNNHLVNGAFLISPFFGFQERKARLLASILASRNFSRKITEAYIPGGGPWSPRAIANSKKPPELFSSDPLRMHLQDWWLCNKPELRIGSPTIGFVQAASKALASLRQPGVLEDITTPAVIFSASDERVVSNTDIFNAASRWRNAFHTPVQGARHEILAEHDRYRLPVLDAIGHYIKLRPAGP